MYLFCMLLLLFFAIIGLCSFITSLIDIMCRSDSSSMLLLKDLQPHDAEARIRSAARICLKHTGIRLVCVIGENDPAYDICRLMQKDYPFMEIKDHTKYH